MSAEQMSCKQNKCEIHYYIVCWPARGSTCVTSQKFDAGERVGLRRGEITKRYVPAPLPPINTEQKVPQRLAVQCSRERRKGELGFWYSYANTFVACKNYLMVQTKSGFYEILRIVLRWKNPSSVKVSKFSEQVWNSGIYILLVLVYAIWKVCVLIYDIWMVYMSSVYSLCPCFVGVLPQSIYMRRTWSLGKYSSWMH